MGTGRRGGRGRRAAAANFRREFAQFAGGGHGPAESVTALSWSSRHHAASPDPAPAARSVATTAEHGACRPNSGPHADAKSESAPLDDGSSGEPADAADGGLASRADSPTSCSRHVWLGPSAAPPTGGERIPLGTWASATVSAYAAATGAWSDERSVSEDAYESRASWRSCPAAE